MHAWPDAAARVAALNSQVQRRQVGPYVVQWNPARANSTMAKVDKKALAERPCFLCKCNRPDVQESIPILDGRWEVLVNPFPILDHHLTIACTAHTPQRMTLQDMADMMAISRMLPDYVVFYNGARCGASAPDHKHLQAGRGMVLSVPECICAVEIDETNLNEAIGDREVNVLVQNGKGYIIPRRAHRPACYHDGSCLVSPGSLDMTGLIITPREEDYLALTEEAITGILQECGIPRCRSCHFLGEDGPRVSVGIMEADKLHAQSHGDTFTLSHVAIGKSFHWQRFQNQTFYGRLRVIPDTASGQKIAVNDVNIEDYLLSVICSEMSGTSSLNLLKAHAVISRSWVLRMILHAQPKQQPQHGHIRWYDATAHTQYDVCADDHCQRYQGLGGVNPIVEQAIRETRGQVLMATDGSVCDARFSKCCGGRTELFSTCWQDVDYDYLQPVDCPYCDTRDANLLRQVLNGYDQETSDFHDWCVEYSQADLSELIEAKLHLGLGTITDIVPLKRGASGRICELRVDGDAGSIILGKELEIRKALSKTHLYSSWFDVKRKANGDFVFAGHGWGHGVGLCQIGAAVMADEGCDYRRILSHYYPTSRIADNYGLGAEKAQSIMI